jgi:hypothetical protein
MPLRLATLRDILTSDGRIWIREGALSQAHVTRRYLVYGTDGRPLARVTSPLDLAAVGDGWAVAWRTGKEYGERRLAILANPSEFASTGPREFSCQTRRGGIDSVYVVELVLKTEAQASEMKGELTVSLEAESGGVSKAQLTPTNGGAECVGGGGVRFYVANHLPDNARIDIRSSTRVLVSVVGVNGDTIAGAVYLEATKRRVALKWGDS